MPKINNMKILSIETSCDETAIAIIEVKNNKIKILADLVSSQIKIHSKFGGVVPEVAARKHLERMTFLVNRAVRKAKIKLATLDYIAVTQGPGLVTSLMVGIETAKTLGYLLNKPVIPINHLEGHFYINWLERAASCARLASRAKQGLRAAGNVFIVKNIKFPVLALIISGGHTKLVLIRDFFKYQVIGTTLDDACGEALDKTAKLIGLGYPGGPELEKLARRARLDSTIESKRGRAGYYDFPRPLINADNFNFSFSGLKTAVLYFLRDAKKNKKRVKKEDLAASVQQAVIDVLVYKTAKAIKRYKIKDLIIGGGVIANNELRKRFNSLAKEHEIDLHLPAKGQATDNALMIAIAAYFKVRKKIKYNKDFEVDPNLKL